ncbi:hypothetical protein GCM10028803_29710 [Larkinella knui]|uniref:Lipoprotein n=1 Tax=Larkinella knui TaxID=2025310 RepID=A0A3P1CX69_9BACT|nr:hypothetical protein [Larkinella knui]RRB18002.1 hypothetical protein EHT87_06935 [Larkinella knui]
MIRPVLFFGLVITLLTACSSGKTALKQGNFDLAVKRASQRLNQPRGFFKRGHEMAPQVLKEAFIHAYNQHQAAIRRLSSAPPSDPNQPAFRWETVFREYTQLQTLTDNARRGFAGRGSARPCDACLAWLSAYPSSYVDRQNEVRELAAADRYQVAEQAFSFREENRLAAKEAYQNYQKAMDWVPDYRQARAKSAAVLPFAILRVVIEPLSPTGEISPRDNQQLQQLIFGHIDRNPKPSTFVQLYLPNEQAGDTFMIHQAVQMQVTGYSPFNETISATSTTVYSNQLYKVGEKKINDSTKVDVMEKVSGTLTTHRREIRAGLDLRMRALDTETGKVLWEEPVWESRCWVTVWETFSGDDRALNGNSLKTADFFAPARWQLYDSMRDELAYDVARRLRSRYAHD